MAPGENSRIKRTMAEIRLTELGGYVGKWVGNHTGHFERASRNSVYKQLRERGYHYDKRYSIWCKS